VTAATAEPGPSFALNGTERMVREAADQALASFADNARIVALESDPLGYDTSAWAEMTRLGWPGFALPEAGGGDGGSLVEVGQLMEAVGWAAYPSPLLEVTTTAAMLSTLRRTAASERAIDGVAGKIGRGAIVILAAPLGDLTTVAARRGLGWVLSGPPRPLAWAGCADELLVLAEIEGKDASALVRVPGPALEGRVRTARSLDNERIGVVDVDGLKAGTVVDGIRPASAERALDRVRLLRAAEMAGGAERTLVMTREYMLERHQFGRPLGAFQAVQHHLADMRIAVDAALLTVREGLSLAEMGASSGASAAIAAFVAGRSYTQVTITAAQLFAGVGAAKDHRLHHHFRRAKAMQLRLGSRTTQLRRILDTAVLDAAPGPWRTPSR